jgi:hypothetical protein
LLPTRKACRFAADAQIITVEFHHIRDETGRVNLDSILSVDLRRKGIAR